jgi:hypothetical protein
MTTPVSAPQLQAVESLLAVVLGLVGAERIAVKLEPLTLLAEYCRPAGVPVEAVSVSVPAQTRAVSVDVGPTTMGDPRLKGSSWNPREFQAAACLPT